MTRLAALSFCVLALATALHAQPAPPLAARIISARIASVNALFRASPKGYDTLFTREFLAEVPPDELSPIFIRYFTDYGGIVGWSYTDSSAPWNAKVLLRSKKQFTIPMSIVI